MKKLEKNPKRILSIWLPQWPIDRLYRAWREATKASESKYYTKLKHPLVLIAASRESQEANKIIKAVNRAATKAGVNPGMTLADAQALVSNLDIQVIEPQEDMNALSNLADWCSRYSPWVTHTTEQDREYGICLNVTGCTHLFDSEVAMLDDLSRKLIGFSVQARIAIADSLGAAWAVTHYGTFYNDQPTICVPVGGSKVALTDLPIAALRLSSKIVEELGRLGLRRIGKLYSLPREALTDRFGPVITRQLDQALGLVAEPLSPIQYSSNFSRSMSFVEPIGNHDHIKLTTKKLVNGLCVILTREGHGAEQLELSLYSVNCAVQRINVSLNKASRDPEHLLRLLVEHLAELDTNFSIDFIILMATQSSSLMPEQITFNGNFYKEYIDDNLILLLDRLGNRLGFDNIIRFVPVESHVPETVIRLAPPLNLDSKIEKQTSWRHISRRPIYLLPSPEQIKVVAEVPNGRPLLFRWRGIAHRVKSDDGPERIAPEWWRNIQTAMTHLNRETRDYYRVEDSRGQRYWLYRRGLYSDESLHELPDWYLHGIFA